VAQKLEIHQFVAEPTNSKEQAGARCIGLAITIMFFFFFFLWGWVVSLLIIDTGQKNRQ
jgi:hypothetical protein